MPVVAKPDIEQALRDVFTGPERKAAAERLGWDNSEVSRFLSGQRGVLINEFEGAMELAGYVPVTPKYLDAISTLCVVGAACQCARNGGGECGNR
ncbi:DNA-binding protein [Burkholderia glumae]|nr:DNA-binding protein [Burkholderia glumae]